MRRVPRMRRALPMGDTFSRDSLAHRSPLERVPQEVVEAFVLRMRGEVALGFEQSCGKVQLAEGTDLRLPPVGLAEFGIGTQTWSPIKGFEDRFGDLKYRMQRGRRGVRARLRARHGPFRSLIPSDPFRSPTNSRE